MQFRIAARQPATIRAFGGRFVGKRRERNDLGAGVAPGVDEMRIDEAEGAIMRQRDALAGRRQSGGTLIRGADRSGAAFAIIASRSRWRSAIAARRSISTARSACSPAWTRPRCRSGNASAASRGTAPNTGMPSAAIASATSARCFSLAARLRITPAMRTAGSCVAKPRTTAAADCACRDTSSTSTTGRPKCAARSAVAPRRPATRRRRRTGPSRLR